MDRVFLLTLLLLFAEGVASETCDHRILEVDAPRFPASLHAQHTVIREGACRVGLIFDLDESGGVFNIRPSIEEDRCKPFHRSAMMALRAGKFSPGPPLDNCTYTFIYEFE